MAYSGKIFPNKKAVANARGYQSITPEVGVLMGAMS